MSLFGFFSVWMDSALRIYSFYSVLICVNVHVHTVCQCVHAWVCACARGRSLACFYPGVCFWPVGGIEQMVPVFVSECMSVCGCN